MLTKKQKKVVKKLNNLLHHRFSEESLNNKLSEIFREPIKVEWSSSNDEDDNGSVDFNLICESKKKKTYGYFDIYVLKQRRQSFDGSTLYVTEIGYEFE